MTDHKLRIGVNWQMDVKAKRSKINGRKKKGAGFMDVISRVF